MDYYNILVIQDLFIIGYLIMAVVGLGMLIYAFIRYY